MNDDIIQQAAEVLAAHSMCMHTNERLGFQRMLAQALADAGLLPTETEWGVQNRDVPVEKEHVFRTRTAAEVAQMIVRANFPWPAEIALVTRHTTPWKAAS